MIPLTYIYDYFYCQVDNIFLWQPHLNQSFQCCELTIISIPTQLVVEQASVLPIHLSPPYHNPKDKSFLKEWQDKTNNLYQQITYTIDGTLWKQFFYDDLYE